MTQSRKGSGKKELNRTIFVVNALERKDNILLIPTWSSCRLLVEKSVDADEVEEDGEKHEPGDEVGAVAEVEV
jgi:hypothetical protein